MAGKTYYSHHISYGSDGRPSSVTTTNKSTGQTTTKKVNRGGGGGGGSSGGGSSGGGSSSNNNTTYKYNATTGYYEPTGGSSSNNYASKYANNPTYQSLVKQYGANNVHNALDYMSSGGSNKGQLKSIIGGNSGSSSSTAGDKNESIQDNYTTASLSNYNNAINHLKSQGMSEDDAKSAASGLLEKQNLLNTKSEEEKAAEMGPINDEDDFDYYQDIFNGLEEDDGLEEEPYDYHQSQEWQDLMGELDYYKDYADNLSSQLESNVVKTSVPEERDTSYDYNTYYKENLAPDNNYENGESKNTLNDKPQTTLVSQYQEPVTTALNDLGLLTPNEQASEEIPNTVEQLPGEKTYNNGDELVQDFYNTIEGMSQEGGLDKKNLLREYKNYRDRLQNMLDSGQISREEFNQFFGQLKNNDTLRNFLQDNK